MSKYMKNVYISISAIPNMQKLLNKDLNKPLQGMAPTECLPSACLPAYLPACLLA